MNSEELVHIRNDHALGGDGIGATMFCGLQENEDLGWLTWYKLADFKAGYQERGKGAVTCLDCIAVFSNRRAIDGAAIDGAIGWCHSCGLTQSADDARLLTPPWAEPGSAPVWVCQECDDEPWTWGVWVVSSPGDDGHEELKAKVGQHSVDRPSA